MKLIKQLYSMNMNSLNIGVQIDLKYISQDPMHISCKKYKTLPLVLDV